MKGNENASEYASETAKIISQIVNELNIKSFSYLCASKENTNSLNVCTCQSFKAIS